MLIIIMISTKNICIHFSHSHSLFAKWHWMCVVILHLDFGLPFLLQYINGWREINAFRTLTGIRSGCSVVTVKIRMNVDRCVAECVLRAFCLCFCVVNIICIIVSQPSIAIKTNFITTAVDLQNNQWFEFQIHHFFIRGVRLIVPHCWSEQFHFTMNNEFEWSLKGSIRPAFSVISKPMFAHGFGTCTITVEFCHCFQYK